jgi:serine/threonine protein phosphatase PrpC
MASEENSNMKYDVALASHRGVERRAAANQDAVAAVLPGIINRRPPLLVLADGMGGYNGGQLASQIVVDTFRKNYFRTSKKVQPLEFMLQAAQDAHKRIQERGQANEKLAKMGTTVVAALLKENNIHLINVGDSRAYLIRETEMMQISYDHSFVAEAIRQGVLTPAEALKHPKRSKLNMSLNAQREEIKPFLASHPLEPADVILLCSDGVWAVLDEATLRDIVFRFPPKVACQKIIDLVNALGGPDNISLAIARLQPPPRDKEEVVETD